MPSIATVPPIVVNLLNGFLLVFGLNDLILQVFIIPQHGQVNNARSRSSCPAWSTIRVASFTRLLKVALPLHSNLPASRSALDLLHQVALAHQLGTSDHAAHRYAEDAVQIDVLAGKE